MLGPDHAPLSKRHGATSVAEFRDRGYLPEALVNYLALLGWSPGEGEEVVPVEEMARRFDLERVTHSAAVFDIGKLAWMNRQYMKRASPERLAATLVRYFERARIRARGRAGGAGVRRRVARADGHRLRRSARRTARSCRRSSSTGTREAAAAVRVEPESGGAAVVTAFAELAVAAGPLVDRDAFRAAATRARERTGAKGKALFHPIRVALTGADSGPELDLAIPAIDRGARLAPASGVRGVISCALRAAARGRSPSLRTSVSIDLRHQCRV